MSSIPLLGQAEGRYIQGMRVTVAKTAGFCWGVRRTVEKTFETMAGSNGGPVVTLGPVIATRKSLSASSPRASEVKDKVTEVEDGTTVVVRTHGALKSEMAAAKDRGLKVVSNT